MMNNEKPIQHTKYLQTLQQLASALNMAAISLAIERISDHVLFDYLR